MNPVFIVIREYQYDGTVIEAVFFDLSSASDHIARQEKPECFDYKVEEWIGTERIKTHESEDWKDSLY